MRIAILIATCSVWMNSALASGVLSTKTDWRSWPEVGQAQLSMLFFDIYQSQLLTPDGQYQLSPDLTPHPLALSITYQRDISQKQLLEATREQWQKLGFDPLQTKQWIEELTAIFPNITQGTNLTYVTDGQQGHFYYAGPQSSSQLIGQIADESLNDAFVAIWLSPQTQYPSLRASLIGNNQ